MLPRLPRIVTRPLVRAVIAVWDALDWVYEKIPVRFRCVHIWGNHRLEEITEKYHYVVHMKCIKCGATATRRG